jgi:hypothetical protein
LCTCLNTALILHAHIISSLYQSHHTINHTYTTAKSAEQAAKAVTAETASGKQTAVTAPAPAAVQAAPSVPAAAAIGARPAAAVSPIAAVQQFSNEEEETPAPAVVQVPVAAAAPKEFSNSSKL